MDYDDLRTSVPHKKRLTRGICLDQSIKNVSL